ncbi:MAG TPA: SDR family oxidoreductase [Thermomicrobiales bacterium]|nr:SDR family oxidoreductase [Thermomicrobiales bacterium]
MSSVGKPSDTILVTGSSTGLGLETALYLAEQGFKVYATVRDIAAEPKVREAAAKRGVELAVLELDITRQESIDTAVERIIGEAGSIYGLVNNGGIGLRGCLEDLSDEEIRRVFEANVFGTIAVTKAVLPHMRAAGRGRVITISSVGGRISSFGVSMYCASKFALEGFGEALALEIAPFGLQSILVEPGIIDTTRWTTHRGLAAGALDPSSPYYRMFQVSEVMSDDIVARSRTKPLHVAKTIHTALTAEKPKMRYIVGRPASAVVKLRRLLPEPFFERVYFGGMLKRLEKDTAEAEGRSVASVGR